MLVRPNQLAPILVLLVASQAFAEGGGIVQRVDPDVAPVTTAATQQPIEGEPKVRDPRSGAEASVVIEAPVEAVWNFLSDNSKARDWSTYFHHITSLDDLAGAVGATRRCFVKEDESGKRWDERVLGTELHRVRHIDMFNMRGYKIPGSKKYRYDVWQLYEVLGPNRTRLTFRSAPAKGSKGMQRMLWWTGARRTTTRIFVVNLENIAAAIEQGADYQRVHPYRP